MNPGQAQAFTWSVTTAGGDSISFSASATGIDAGTGTTVFGSSWGQSELDVVPGGADGALLAMLEFPNYPRNGPPCVGDLLVIGMTVENTGSVDLTDVAGALQVNAGPPNAVLMGGPVPAGPLTLAGGGATRFDWTFSIVGDGSLVDFTFTATGIDSVTFQNLLVALPMSGTIEGPPVLTAGFGALPGAVSEGWMFQVTLSVSNSGERPAAGVRAEPPRVEGSGSVFLVSGPGSASREIDTGSATEFVWTFEARAAGTVSFGTTVTGVVYDCGTPLPLVAAQSAAVTIAPWPAPVLTATPQNQQVALTWTSAPPGLNPVNGYEVFLSFTPGMAGAPVAFLGTGVTTWTDNGLANGTLHYYHVRAVDTMGNAGPFSGEVAVQPSDAIVNPPPCLTETQLGNSNRVWLDWSFAPSGTHPATGYAIYRNTYPGTGTSAGAIQVLPAFSDDFLDTPLTSGVFWYHVRAIGSLSDPSPLSNSIYISGMPPTTPGNLSAVGQPGQIALNWDPSAPGSYPVAGYVIYKATFPIGYGVPPAATVYGVTDYTDMAVMTGVTYFYTVNAIDDRPVPNESGASNQASAVPSGPPPPPPCPSGPGLISTLAGTGNNGYNGDGQPATNAWLAGPRGVAVDGMNQVFVADTGNHRIRRIGTAGNIFLLAGNGTPGFGGDGGQATAAQLDQPSGIALDGAGNFYIADTFNHRVRRVDAGTGVITTVAGNGTPGFGGDGGQATDANLLVPMDVVLDGAGNL
ncbi:MAG: hypothetical protein AAB368_00365, partial [bacterium]